MCNSVVGFEDCRLGHLFPDLHEDETGWELRKTGDGVALPTFSCPKYKTNSHRTTLVALSPRPQRK